MAFNEEEESLCAVDMAMNISYATKTSHHVDYKGLQHWFTMPHRVSASRTGGGQVNFGEQSTRLQHTQRKSAKSQAV